MDTRILFEKEQEMSKEEVAQRLSKGIKEKEFVMTFTYNNRVEVYVGHNETGRLMKDEELVRRFHEAKNRLQGEDNHRIPYTFESLVRRIEFHKKQLEKSKTFQKTHQAQIERFERLLETADKNGWVFID